MKNRKAERLGIYIHIPFCIRKCNYCDFRSFGNTGTEEQRVYIEALCKEIDEYKNEEQGEIGSAENGINVNKYYVDSIFFGGGTPSLLEPELIGQVMDQLRQTFQISGDAEITLESNPGTLTMDKLRSYKVMGINRLSIGVQSMDQQVLQRLGRIHSPQEVRESFRMARAAGFHNINVDLMFGIPDQSFQQWERTVDEILELEPEHISFYSLQIEEETPFYRQLQSGELAQPSEELDRRMYHWILQRLADTGYQHYEVSNGAKAGKECRHNLKYWSMADYLGMGLAAHSYIRGVRFFNTSEMERYLAGDHLENVSPNTRSDSISDYLFTELRKIEGISLNEFEERYGEPLTALFGKQIREFLRQGLLEIKGDCLRFTLKGLDYTNTVLRELMTAGGIES